MNTMAPADATKAATVSGIVRRSSTGPPFIEHAALHCNVTFCSISLRATQRCFPEVGKRAGDEAIDYGLAWDAGPLPVGAAGDAEQQDVLEDP
jgi:hypothetical protein